MFPKKNPLSRRLPNIVCQLSITSKENNEPVQKSQTINKRQDHCWCLRGDRQVAWLEAGYSEDSFCGRIGSAHHSRVPGVYHSLGNRSGRTLARRTPIESHSVFRSGLLIAIKDIPHKTQNVSFEVRFRQDVGYVQSKYFFTDFRIEVAAGDNALYRRVNPLHLP